MTLYLHGKSRLEEAYTILSECCFGRKTLKKSGYFLPALAIWLSEKNANTQIIAGPGKLNTLLDTQNEQE